MNRILMITALALCFISVKNCVNCCPGQKQQSVYYGDSLMNAWTREKLAMQTEYEARIKKLESEKDSLQLLAGSQKRKLANQRVKTEALKARIAEAVTVIDSTGCLPDTVRTLVKDYVNAESENDSLCDATISSLEQLLANREDAISGFRQVENIQRDLLKEQQLRNSHLTEQLNSAYKVQKRKSRQNRILAGGILLLSGITTSILLTNSEK
jgi:hypothetical protein